MKIVVTGATGHIGATLVRRLLALGHTVRAVCFDRLESLAGLDVERVPGDVREPAQLRAAFKGQDALVHLAAIIDIDGRHGDQLRAVNVDGVRNAAEAALATNVARMVHVSSVHAYATYRLGSPLTEDHPKATDRFYPAYDRSKAAGEAELRSVVARGLDATILNPGGVIGPLDFAPSHLGNMFQRMARGLVPIIPRGGFVWLDVRDVVDAIVVALESGRRGENYLLASAHATLVEIDSWIAAESQRTWHALHVDPSLLRPLLWIAPLVARLYGRTTGFTRDGMHTLSSELTVDCSKARRELGFNPRPVRESLADALAWFRARGALRPPRWQPGVLRLR